MSDWTSGYVADINYTHGYYEDMNPLRIKLAFLRAGLAAPQISNACELGFGWGMSVNLYAASSEVTWHGNDFNPAQAAFARQMMDTSGAEGLLVDEAFDEFCTRDDLPEFDYIALHGIWSWISDDNRQVIVDFLRKKLKVGGVLYISYNALPGFAPFVPVRNLMFEHVHRHGSAASLKERITASVGFAQQLMELNPRFGVANPGIVDRLKGVADKPAEYLAHEYFNTDWEPMDFAQMNEWLADAKMSYACSANFHDHVPVLNLTKEQQEFLAAIDDPVIRENTRDLIMNQQFRKDYWVKGGNETRGLESIEMLKQEHVILIRPLEDVKYKINFNGKEISLSESVYRPFVEALDGYRVRNIGDLAQEVEAKGISIGQVFEAMLVMIGSNYVKPAYPDASEEVKERSRRINEAICTYARSHNKISFLASPVTAGGQVVSRFEQLFLLARAAGIPESQWAEYVVGLLFPQGEKMVVDDKVLETPEENVKAMQDNVDQFVEKRLPLLEKLGVA